MTNHLVTRQQALAITTQIEQAVKGISMAAKTLYINQNGRVVCLKHGGGYLNSAIENRPNAMNIDTPLDNWERLDDEVLAEVPDVDCEDC